ncbi:DUF3011 domain-containing protein [Coralloluteibacterium thermophilus]|uniref:DUF3011 domain-containing protein n=1 Tax=Coralloluteibacterium thermophilum TaxID=2707049 RepID=A0ABV9NQI1_9GAMM
MNAKILTCALLAVAGVGLAAVAAPASAQRFGGGGGESLRCKSYDFGRNYCRMDTRGGVELVRQHSRTDCRQGRNWGWDRNGVWVDAGCDAEFRSARGGGQSAHTLRCKSHDFGRNYCRTDTRGGVRLVRQHSRTECRQGRNWGWDRNGIWVDNGCDAEFSTGSNQSRGRWR